MRRSLAAVALISRLHQGRTLWLAQWNPHWGCYHFVSGHKGQDESFRQCMVRELAEELSLQAEVDFRFPAEPTTLEYTAWSESAQAKTEYSMEVFQVELVGDNGNQRVDSNPPNRWLSEAEICAERSSDCKRISPTMGLLLQKCDRWSLDVSWNKAVKVADGQYIEALLRALYEGEVEAVQVTKTCERAPGRPLVFHVSLYSRKNDPGSFLREEIVKVSDEPRLQKEQANYQQIISQLGRVLFLEARKLQPALVPGKRAALVYSSAEAALTRHGTEVMTLAEYCDHYLASDPGRIEKAVQDVVDRCLLPLYQPLELVPELPPQVVKFWDDKFTKFGEKIKQGLDEARSSTWWKESPLSQFGLSAKFVENGTHLERHGGRSLQNAVESVGNGLRAVPVPGHFNIFGGEPHETVIKQLLGDTQHPARLSRIHGDLNLGNILIASGTPCIIDYEDVRAKGPTAFDLVKLEVEFGNHVLYRIQPAEYYHLYQILNWVSGTRARQESEHKTRDRIVNKLFRWLAGHTGSEVSEANAWQRALKAGPSRNAFRVLFWLRRKAREILYPGVSQCDWCFDYSRWVCLYALLTLGFEQLSPDQKAAGLTTAHHAFLYRRQYQEVRHA